MSDYSCKIECQPNYYCVIFGNCTKCINRDILLSFRYIHNYIIIWKCIDKRIIMALCDTNILIYPNNVFADYKSLINVIDQLENITNAFHT